MVWYKELKNIQVIVVIKCMTHKSPQSDFKWFMDKRGSHKVQFIDGLLTAD